MGRGSSARVDISRRRSDKFGPDYAAVTFIFIEILHPNDHPYFSIGRDFAATLLPLLLPDKGACSRGPPSQHRSRGLITLDVEEEEEDDREGN